MNCHVLVDFDGTLVPSDATDSLLERFAAPEWRAVESLWQAGRIGSRDCLARQVALLRASPAQLDAAIDEIGIDPGFYDFMNLCGSYGITASLVSDGFDRVIRRVLFNHGIVMNYTANCLESAGGDLWQISFPHAGDDCRMNAGHCKCATAGQQCRGARIVIGDGRSDLCVADGADLVLAKASLIELCSRNDIAHTAIAGFADATEVFGSWLRARYFVPRVGLYSGAASPARRAAGKEALPGASTGL